MNVWTISLTESEFVKGHQFFLRTSLLTFRNIAMLLLAFLMVLAQAQVLGPQSTAPWILFALFLALLGFLFTVYLEMPRRLFRKREELRNSWQLAFYSEGIEVIQSSGSRTYGFDEVLKAIEGRDQWVLQISGGLPLIVPRRVLADHELDFRKCIEEFQCRRSSSK
jgi:phosphatidylglycerophosphate synthase